MIGRCLKIWSSFFVCFLFLEAAAQPKELDDDNIVWTTQSRNSGESMPCGGGSIGLNVWVENSEILFYISRSGSFDENNALLKSGRVRLKLSPNPFVGSFRQTLDLKTGAITIRGTNGKQKVSVHCWVDVFHPVIHLQLTSNRPL
ncbi:MAG TPA: DUF5703 domain-containing protein, partial [Flavisolibacter sp.]|nr:DUF5703 domain-containing protein [Flavisolibacter sp.]